MVEDQTETTDVERLGQLLVMWHATRQWAEAMLRGFLGVTAASDVLQPRLRGGWRLGRTSWFYRTHGLGLEITKDDEADGIDFDFDKVAPDVWRLHLFAEKQLEAGHIPAGEYAALVADEERFRQAARAVLDTTK